MKDENEEQPMKKKTEKKPKPIEDMALGVVHVQYTTQGLKEPHREVGGEGRPVPANEFLGAATPSGDPRRWWPFRATGLQRPQDVCSVFFEMNLNPGEINFKQCKASLLEHALETNHDWSTHLSWKDVNKLKLKGFPEASLGLNSAYGAVLS